MSDFYGFNGDEVRNSVRELKSAYEEIVDVLKGDTERKFVDTLSRKWFAPEAVQFAQGPLKEVFDSALRDVNRCLQSAVTVTEDHASRYAQAMNSSYSRVGWDFDVPTLNVDAIQSAKPNGDQGIENDTEDESQKNLSQIANRLDEGLKRARRAVDNCGFLGSNSSTALQSAITTIGNNINRAFADIGTATHSAIKNTQTKYANLDKASANSFSGNDVA